MWDFYPRPPRGGRLQQGLHHRHCAQYFYPRPPRGGRRAVLGKKWIKRGYFYPRPPRGGRQPQRGVQVFFEFISIHALLAEGDFIHFFPRTAHARFLSTPSSRRATSLPGVIANSIKYFYPRPPRGGRHAEYKNHSDELVAISIHALLAEGDPWTRRTKMNLQISIHALLAEGDSKNREKNILLLSHYTPLCTNCKEMLAKQTAKSHRYLRKRLVFRCEASRKTMCAADSHWPDIKRSARCLGQTPGAVQRARPWSGSCCPAGRTADCPRQGRSGRSALL